MPLDVYEISVIYKQSIQKKGFLNCMEIYIFFFFCELRSWFINESTTDLIFQFFCKLLSYIQLLRE